MKRKFKIDLTLLQVDIYDKDLYDKSLERYSYPTFIDGCYLILSNEYKSNYYNIHRYYNNYKISVYKTDLIGKMNFDMGEIDTDKIIADITEKYKNIMNKEILFHHQPIIDDNFYLAIIHM